VPDMPLNLMVERQANDSLSLQLMHDLRHYSRADATLRLDMLAHALACLPDLAGTPVAHIDTLPPALHDQLRQGGHTPLSPGHAPTVLHAILEHAGSRADATAVVHGEQRWSYRVLLTSAQAIAEQLQARGVQRGQRVGLHLERTPLALAAILGIMLCGASYVPIDLDAPPDRKTFIATEAGLAAIVSATPDTVGGIMPLAVTGPDTLAGMPPDPPACRPDDEAYVIFTSGSTGR